MINNFEKMLMSSAERAFSGVEIPNSLLSFSMQYEEASSILLCLSIFSKTPNDEEIDMISSAIAEIEADHWVFFNGATDQYVSILDNPAITPLKMEIYTNGSYTSAT